MLPRIVALVAGALVLAACGGDGQDPTVQDDGGDQEAAGDAADGQDGGDTGDGGSQAADSGTFAELASQGFTSSARVTYEARSPGSDTQQLVLSSDGEQTAWLMPNARMIVRGDGTQIFCNESGGPAQCFQMSGQAPSGAMAPAAGGPFLGLATGFQEALQESREHLPGFASTGEEEIAGRTATCGTFDPNQLATGGQDAGEATLCVDTETGVVLRYEATSPQGGTTSLTAVEVGEPRASDFEAPAEPRSMEDLQNMMEGMGQGG